MGRRQHCSLRFCMMHKDSRTGTRSGSIHVYGLIPPEAIVKHERTLAELLFGMKSTNEGGRYFRVSPISGCISFADYGRLWKNTKADAIPTSSRAAAQAA